MVKYCNMNFFFLPSHLDQDEQEGSGSEAADSRGHQKMRYQIFPHISILGKKHA